MGAAVLIPDNYVADLPVRLGLYRRLSNLQSKAELDGFAVELVDRFGALPEPVENLLKVVRIKQLCRRAGVEKVDAGPKGTVLSFRKDKFANPEGLIGFLQEQAGAAKLRPDHKLVVTKAWETPDRRLRGVSNIMVTLAKLVG